MFNRWIGICCGLAMLAANYALLQRTVLPRWTAGDPPETVTGLIQAGEQHHSQTAIFNDRGLLIGRSWTVAARYARTVDFRSVTLLRQLSIANRPVPPVRWEIRLTFQNDRPDDLQIRLGGLGVAAYIKGEDFAGSFPCEWRFGEQYGTFMLDPEVLSTLGDVVRPFEELRGLYVGMTWRIKLFNPLPSFLPGLPLDMTPVDEMLVEVTSETTEQDPVTGEPVKAFVVEADGIRAFVATNGRVLRQEVDLPMIGRLILIEEAFDEQAYTNAAGGSWEPTPGERSGRGRDN